MHLIRDDLLVSYQKGSKVDNISHPLKVSIPTNPYVIQTMKVEIDNDEYHRCMDSLYFYINMDLL